MFRVDCYRSDRMRRLMFTHGQRGGDLRSETPPEYKAWDSLKQRCQNPDDPSFQDYGGRGISIHPDWENDFLAFHAHVGDRPTPDHSIERIDNYGDYAPGNVRWATRSEQARNRRSNRIVNYDGQEMCLVAACELAGLPYKSVKNRLYKGWPESRALSEPIGR